MLRSGVWVPMAKGCAGVSLWGAQWGRPGGLGRVLWVPLQGVLRALDDCAGCLGCPGYLRCSGCPSRIPRVPPQGAWGALDALGAPPRCLGCPGVPFRLPGVLWVSIQGVPGASSGHPEHPPKPIT